VVRGGGGAAAFGSTDDRGWRVNEVNSLENQFANTSPGDFGVFGDPISHTLSPTMQNAALDEWWKSHGVQNHKRPVYHAFRVRKDELREALELAKKYQLHGLNLTIPLKEIAADFVTSLDEFAAESKSINTVSFSDAETKGYNTDGYGFEMALKQGLHFDPMGKNALVLGAGGTGKIILRQLCLSGIKRIALWNRTADRSAMVVRDLKKKLDIVHVETDKELKMALSASDLIVNATSIGLKEKDPLPVPGLSFSSSQVCFDVVYHRETEFVSQAKKAGAQASGGLDMLLYQGARAFEIWTK
jgi:shikimate dehydrogenase